MRAGYETVKVKECIRWKRRAIRACGAVYIYRLSASFRQILQLLFYRCLHTLSASLSAKMLGSNSRQAFVQSTLWRIHFMFPPARWGAVCMGIAAA